MEDRMVEIEKKRQISWQQIGSVIYGILTNLLAGLVFAIVFIIVNSYGKKVLEPPTSTLIAWVGAILFWCISYGIVVFLIRRGKRYRKYLKYLGYYFLPTTLFVLFFEERNRRRKAEEKLLWLEKILNGSPESIIRGVFDPEKQRETFGYIIAEMHRIEDHVLAKILDNIRNHPDHIIGLVEGNRNYDLFRQLMEKVSHFQPDAWPKTYACFLWELTDVFRMPFGGCYTRRVQKDMIGPLKNSVRMVGKSHFNRIRTIIEQIMCDEEDDLARQILEILLQLNCQEMREIGQIIFDESKKRAFKHQRSFGLDFLITLCQLEHKVFWLDLQSLRDISDQGVRNGDTSLVKSEPEAYKELCLKVFATLEDEEHRGKHSYRVWRRLKAADGKAQVECTFPDGNVHTCDGESLSFRGLFSKTCTLKPGEKLQAKVTIPIIEIGQVKPGHEFSLKASVAKIHDAEASTQSPGRGIFFEDADEEVVKGLYQYVSEHRK
jgi:hypothetical protein